jgi:hypothetical protein
MIVNKSYDCDVNVGEGVLRIGCRSSASPSKIVDS